MACLSRDAADCAPAREYWLLFRYEEQGLPALSAAGEILAAFKDDLALAEARKLKVAGLQLDIDSPTRELSQYAALLREVHKGLPEGTQLSITALLDWFRPGTSIGEVIKETDEFVPQFYDIGATGRADNWQAIAAKVDPAAWAQEFNRFRKRYRVGVSSFGRARFVENVSGARSGVYGIRLFSDITPLDIGLNPAFQLQVSHTDAGEAVLNYRAARKARIAYSSFDPGDVVQFVVPTSASVRSAVENVKRMGGYCAGVVFFRWPASNENLILGPDEALAAAGAIPQLDKSASVELQDGHCAAVNCVDVFLVNAKRLAADALDYRIQSSTEMEYFLPEEGVPARMTGPSTINIKFPPYAAVSRILLGRAVSERRAEFRVDLAP